MKETTKQREEREKELKKYDEDLHWCVQCGCEVGENTPLCSDCRCEI